MEFTVRPTSVSGTIVPPSSKSYAQRAFAAALLADGVSKLSNIQMCDDTVSALGVISHLGAKIDYPENNTITVRGGFHPTSEVLNIGESGLGARIFTPIAALWNEPIAIIGVKSIITRPMGMMIQPLQNLGVTVKSDGFLPITVTGPIRGGETEVDGFVSSQFVTGLLLALPIAQGDSVLHINKANSTPYLDITIDVAQRFGITIDHNGYTDFFIRGNQRYVPTDLSIEGDWSGAAFILTAGAVAGKVNVKNMNMLSKQADTAIVDILSRAGAEIVSQNEEISVSKRELSAFEADLTNCPDLFPIAAVLAANCSGSSILHGAARLMYKESNRAEAILEEYAKIGIRTRLADQDTMIVEGAPITGGTISSRGDHRIAMAGAIAGLTSRNGVTITDAETVSKSYPHFWQDLKYISKFTVR